MDDVWIVRPIKWGVTTLIAILIIGILYGGLVELAEYVVKNISIIMFVSVIISIVLSIMIGIKNKDVINVSLSIFAFSQLISFLWGGLVIAGYEKYDFDKVFTFIFTLIYSACNLAVVLDMWFCCFKNNLIEDDRKCSGLTLGEVGVFGWMVNYIFFVIN